MASPEVRLTQAVGALGIATVVRCDALPDVKQIRMLIRVEHESDKRKNPNAARAWLAVVDAILMEEERLVEELQEEHEIEMAEYEELMAEITEEEGETEKPPEMGAPAWNVHICKHYMRRKGKLLFGWNLTLQANSNLRSAVSDICRLLAIMGRHVGTFLQQPVLQPVPAQQRQQSSLVMQAAQPLNVQQGMTQNVAGTGVSGIIDDMGQVVEMPLIGVTAQRNAPQAPMLTPGVGGLGRRSGVSSKGAHSVRG